MISLKPTARLVHVGAGLQVEFPDYTVSLSGSPVVPVVCELWQRLKRPVDEAALIVEVAQHCGEPDAVVGYIVRLLDENRCLNHVDEIADGSDNDGMKSLAAEPLPDPALLEYLSHASSAPGRALARLRAFTPWLIGPRRELDDLLPALRDMQIEPTCLHTDALPDVGALLAELDHGGGANPSALLVCWGLPYRYCASRGINQWAQHAKRDVLFGYSEGSRAALGPHVMAGSGPCLECLRQREASNQPAPEQARHARAVFRLDEPVYGPLVVNRAFSRAVAGLLATELYRLATQQFPTWAGASTAWHVDMPSGETRTLHRLPRCPACHTLKPARSSWDARFSAPLVKDAHPSVSRPNDGPAVD